MLSRFLFSYADRFIALAKRNKERGSKQEYIKQTLETVKSYVSEPPRAALHFGKFPKLGINPRSQYKTPIGIYGYPLTPTIYKQFLNFELPFVADNPYIVLFEFGGKVLNFYNYSQEELEADIEKLYHLAGETPPSDEQIIKWQSETIINPFARATDPQWTIWRTINRAKATAFELGTAGSQFMNITRLLANQDAKKWNVLLRRLGYDVLVDEGRGFIHSNEPTQMVILNPSVVNVVDIFDNFMYIMEEVESKTTGHREKLPLRSKVNSQWFIKQVQEHPILETVLLKLFQVDELAKIPIYSSLLHRTSLPHLLDIFFGAKYISKEDKEEFIKSLIANDHGGLLSSAMNSIKEFYEGRTVPRWFAGFILKNELGYIFNPEFFISQEDLMHLAGEMPKIFAASPNWTHLYAKTQQYFMHNPEILKYRLIEDPRLFTVYADRIRTLYKEFPETRETIAINFEINLNKLASIELKDVNTGTYFYEVEANRGSKAIIETLIFLSNNQKKADWATGSRMSKAGRDQLYQWLLTHSTPEMRMQWNEINEPKL